MIETAAAQQQQNVELNTGDVQMKLSTLQSVYDAPKPFVTVCMDVSRTDADAAQQVRLRWRGLAAQLQRAGARGDLVEEIGERVVEPTDHGGRLSRFMVASRDGIVLDELLPGSRPADAAHVGHLPHLLPLVASRTTEVPYAVVKADHVGADISCVTNSLEPPTRVESSGGHDVLHKVPGGGWSQRRYQSRVNDSWDRNAAQVAHDLDAVVARHEPVLVFLVGEPYSRSMIREQATGRVAERLVELDHGSRAPGSSDEALDAEIRERLAAHRQRVCDDLVESFLSLSGRGGRTATGVGGVVEALRRSAVETLLLADGVAVDEDRLLYAGPEAAQLGTEQAQLEAMAAEEVFQDRMQEVLLRALVAQDGDVALLSEPPRELRDGVGAVLRFDLAAR